MIREICTVLKDRALTGESLKFIDVVAGLADTVKYKSEDENGNPLTKTMPVSYDTNLISACRTGPEKALTPDSSKKGILYFEENGPAQTVRYLSGGRAMMRVPVRAVVWINKSNTIGEIYGKAATAVYRELQQKLAGHFETADFANGKVQVLGFRQDSSLFSRYSYDETVLQFLRPPFEAFAIDLSISFTLACGSPVFLNPKIC